MKKINPSYARAQATLEFALVLPLLLLVILFTLDLGRVIFFKSLMNNAAREGARFASVYVYSAPLDLITPAVETTAFIEGYTDLLGDAQILVEYDIADRWNPSVTVKIDYDVKPITPILPIFLSGSEIHLTTASEMRLE